MSSKSWTWDEPGGSGSFGCPRTNMVGYSLSLLCSEQMTKGAFPLPNRLPVCAYSLQRYAQAPPLGSSNTAILVGRLDRNRDRQRVWAIGWSPTP